MTRFTLKSALMGIATATIFTLTSLVPDVAHAARPFHAIRDLTPGVSNPDEGKNCHSLSVHLNGNLPVVLYCPEKHPTAGSAFSGSFPESSLGVFSALGVQAQFAVRPAAHPQIAWDGNCAHDYVHIWSDSNHTGDSVYFCGPGSLNMDQVLRGWGGIYGNWDRIASSYEINNAYCTGSFWAGQFETGQRQNFGPGNTANFDGNNGRLPNDSLRSLTLSSSCPNS